MGLLTDNRGPRLTTLIGAVSLGVGYFPLHLGTITLGLRLADKDVR